MSPRSTPTPLNLDLARRSTRVPTACDRRREPMFEKHSPTQKSILRWISGREIPPNTSAIDRLREDRSGTSWTDFLNKLGAAKTTKRLLTICPERIQLNRPTSVSAATSDLVEATQIQSNRSNAGRTHTKLGRNQPTCLSAIRRNMAEPAQIGPGSLQNSTTPKRSNCDSDTRSAPARTVERMRGDEGPMSNEDDSWGS